MNSIEITTPVRRRLRVEEALQRVLQAAALEATEGQRCAGGAAGGQREQGDRRVDQARRQQADQQQRQQAVGVVAPQLRRVAAHQRLQARVDAPHQQGHQQQQDQGGNFHVSASAWPDRPVQNSDCKPERGRPGGRAALPIDNCVVREQYVPVSAPFRAPRRLARIGPP
ncbi:hypothetical protein [Rugamonas sp. DEMB1]|uniref:hypothetical protein n=1 Tax=Rugamonas sp. DEMB1 TaxID=3039386 RepID=UPI00244A3433|nr:hypothetical protein [Rugamonas sp. DEMB1]WGG49934.1 hypothetical protein QC826_26225 [Rugamonas sp. DEMB1]